MAFLSAGTFLMGASSAYPMTDENAEDTIGDEKPQHRVNVAVTCIDLVPISNEAYAACVAAGQCAAISSKHSQCEHAGHEEFPVTCLTQPQAAAYCARRGARLPTEVEWEYAARGTDGRVYAWGDRPLPSDPKEPLRTCREQFKARLTCPVGSAPAGRSPFGVYDMGGNVEEWTSSPFCAYPNHDCAGLPGQFVIRSASGGADETSRVTARASAPATDTSPTRGFRCARTP
jgi:formylglycine-generating enzyme required for sulfatase activity